MGHAFDKQLLALVQQTLALFRKDFAAIQAVVASLEGTLENQRQRLDEVEAHHAKYAKEMDDNYNHVMEMIENLKAQLRPGILVHSGEFCS